MVRGPQIYRSEEGEMRNTSIRLVVPKGIRLRVCVPLGYRLKVRFLEDGRIEVSLEPP